MPYHEVRVSSVSEEDHMPLVILPVACLALVALATTLAVRPSRGAHRPDAGALAWLVPPVAALAALVALCALGLYVGEAGELVACCLAALLAAAAALARPRSLALLDDVAGRVGLKPRAGRAVVAVLALLLCTALGFLAIELPYNPAALQIAPNFALIQGLIILGALTLGLFLFQRHGAGLALGVVVCALIGVAQFFVKSFKASAILPNDLFVLGTAAAVSGSYVYSVDGAVLLGLSCALLACAACTVVAPPSAADSRALVRRTLANLACALAAFAALWAGVTVPDYFGQLGVGMEYWYTLDYYERQGFVTTFVAVAQDLPVDEPEGYSDESARELEAAYATTYDETLGATEARTAAAEQFAKEQPTVICVMNETFADLSSLEGASWGYAGPERYASVDDALMGGELAVSVIGGGTCNSEFEFLTGIPLAYVGDGKYPYSLYDLSDAPSVAEQLSALGYSTTAIHPNYATNWNRDRVYEMLGFDRFLTIDDFAGAEQFHSGVSDAETYDKVLELLEADDGPQFIFDVTMQNHSSYDQGNIGEVEQYAVGGLSDYDNDRLSEYLACIEESDRALAEFMAELEQLDRPVVLVFFGDHQPALSSIVADALYPDEDPSSLEHSLRTHETTYFVWANYDVAGSAQVSEGQSTSPAYLAALMAEAIGAPLSDYQKALLVAREEMPCLSLVGAQGADGTWYELEDADALGAAYDDLASISYLEFASKLE